MQLEFLLNLITQYGYPAMFFALCLGIVGMPIPDEVIVMTGGMVASFHLLEPIPAFIMTYLGVVSGLSIGYVLGRIMGPPVLIRLSKKKRVAKYIENSQQLLNRFGRSALIISYLFPVVRHIVPYLVGINNMSFPRYAVFSYSSGFVWTLFYFILGYFFGNNIGTIGTFVYQFGWYMLIAGLLLFVFGWTINYFLKKR
jgi:membrane-associated protein